MTFHVISASYGSDAKRADVTSRLRSHFVKGDVMHIPKVDNNSCGCDPHFGTQKC